MKLFTLASVLVLALLFMVPTASLAVDSHSEPDPIALKSITARILAATCVFSRRT